MMLHHLLLQSSISIPTFSTKFRLLCSPVLRTSRTIAICTKMSSDSSSTLTHTINLPTQLGEPVKIVAAPCVSDSEFRNAIESSLFKQWLKNIQTETGILANGAISLRQVLIQGVDMFGKRIGFLKFKADVIDKETGNKIPGIVFARGPAVAVLILLDSEGETYAVLTEQVRVPVGRLILELPAGMLDDDKGDFVGTAVREVEEETGIRLNLDDMVDLTAFLDPSTGCRAFPSPGGCDEEISLFLYRGQVDKETITELRGKETGLQERGEMIKVHVVPYEKLWRMTADAKGGCDEEISLFLYRGQVDKETITELRGKETGLRKRGEMIKVHVVPYEKLWRMTADAKVLMAIALYEMAKKEGLLPPRRNLTA